MTRLLILAAALLAGCALTPVELKQQGYQGTYHRKGKAPEIATCVERFIRNAHGEFSTWRDTRVGIEEVGGRLPDAGTAILVQVWQNGDGADVSVYLHPQVFSKDREVVARELLAGC